MLLLQVTSSEVTESGLTSTVSESSDSDHLASIALKGRSDEASNENNDDGNRRRRKHVRGRRQRIRLTRADPRRRQLRRITKAIKSYLRKKRISLSDLDSSTLQKLKRVYSATAIKKRRNKKKSSSRQKGEMYQPNPSQGKYHVKDLLQKKNSFIDNTPQNDHQKSNRKVPFKTIPIKELNNDDDQNENEQPMKIVKTVPSARELNKIFKSKKRPQKVKVIVVEKYDEEKNPQSHNTQSNSKSRGSSHANKGSNKHEKRPDKTKAVKLQSVEVEEPMDTESVGNERPHGIIHQAHTFKKTDDTEEHIPKDSNPARKRPAKKQNLNEDGYKMKALSAVVDRYTQELSDQEDILSQILEDTKQAEKILTDQNQFPSLPSNKTTKEGYLNTQLPSTTLKPAQDAEDEKQELTADGKTMGKEHDGSYQKLQVSDRNKDGSNVKDQEQELNQASRFSNVGNSASELPATITGAVVSHMEGMNQDLSTAKKSSTNNFSNSSRRVDFNTVEDQKNTVLMSGRNPVGNTDRPKQYLPPTDLQSKTDTINVVNPKPLLSTREEIVTVKESQPVRQTTLPTVNIQSKNVPMNDEGISRESKDSKEPDRSNGVTVKDPKQDVSASAANNVKDVPTTEPEAAGYDASLHTNMQQDEPNIGFKVLKQNGSTRDKEQTANVQGVREALAAIFRERFNADNARKNGQVDETEGSGFFTKLDLRHDALGIDTETANLKKNGASDNIPINANVTYSNGQHNRNRLLTSAEASMEDDLQQDLSTTNDENARKGNNSDHLSTLISNNKSRNVGTKLGKNNPQQEKSKLGSSVRNDRANIIVVSGATHKKTRVEENTDRTGTDHVEKSTGKSELSLRPNVQTNELDDRKSNKQRGESIKQSHPSNVHTYPDVGREAIPTSNEELQEKVLALLLLRHPMLRQQRFLEDGLREATRAHSTPRNGVTSPDKPVTRIPSMLSRAKSMRVLDDRGNYSGLILLHSGIAELRADDISTKIVVPNNMTNGTSSERLSLFGGHFFFSNTFLTAVGFGTVFLVFCFFLCVCCITRWFRHRKYRKAFNKMEESFSGLTTDKPIYLRLGQLRRCKAGNQYVVTIVDDTKFSVVNHDLESEDEIFDVTDIKKADKKGPLSRLQWTNPKHTY
ncbi:hypothetical protein V1264_006584 [Littorina saxatilis]